MLLMVSVRVPIATGSPASGFNHPTDS
jgi:hypothetical protein